MADVTTESLQEQYRIVTLMLTDAERRMLEAQTAYERAQGLLVEARGDYNAAQTLQKSLQRRLNEESSNGSSIIPIISIISDQIKADLGDSIKSDGVILGIKILDRFGVRGDVKTLMPTGSNLSDSRVSDLLTDHYRAGDIVRLQYSGSKALIAHGLKDWVVRRGGALELRDEKYFPQGESWGRLDRSKIVLSYEGDINNIETV